MDFDGIRRLLATYPGTRILEANGDAFAIHDPDGDLPPRRQIPWATLVGSDAYDTVSALDRPGVFRLNLGLPRERARALVDPDAEHDLTALDTLLPHPEYGRQGWVCVLSPERTWPDVRALVDLARAHAAQRFDAARR